MTDIIESRSEQVETLTTSHYKDRTDWHFKSVRHDGESDDEWRARHMAFDKQILLAYGSPKDLLEATLEASIAARGAKP